MVTAAQLRRIRRPIGRPTPQPTQTFVAPQQVQQAAQQQQESVKIGGTEFSVVELNKALERARLIAKGKPLGDVGGKKAFDKLQSISPDFKRAILKGQASRLTSAQLLEMGGKSFAVKSELEGRFGISGLKELKGIQEGTVVDSTSGKMSVRTQEKLLIPRTSTKTNIDKLLGRDKDFVFKPTQAKKTIKEIKKINIVNIIPNKKIRDFINERLTKIETEINKPGRFESAAGKLIDLSEFISEKTGFEKRFEGTFLGTKVKRSSGEQVVGDLLKGFFFSQAFTTSGTQTQILTAKEKELLSKSRFADISLDDVVNAFDDLSKKGDSKSVIDNLKKGMESISKIEDPKTKQIAIDNLKKLLIKLGEKGIVNFNPTANTISGGLPSATLRPLTKTGVNKIILNLEVPVTTKGGGLLISGATTLGKFEEKSESTRFPQTDKAKVNSLLVSVGIAKNNLRIVTAQKGSQSDINKLSDKLKNAQKDLQKERSAQASSLKSKQAQQPKLAQQPRFRTPPILKTPTRFGRPTKFRTPTKPGIPKPPKLFIPPPFFSRKRIVKRAKKTKPILKFGYNTLIKSKGKFKKVNVVPIKKNKAIDLGAYLTDNSTARTFLIRKTDKKVKKPTLKVPSSYFARTQKKFRKPIIKGVKQKLSPLFIEKKTKLIDTRGEKKGLKVAKLRARLFKKSKVRRKKR